MSFQAYLDTIKAKTGKTPEDIRDAARDAGVLRPDLKAGELREWLKNEYGLGHGHAGALWAVFVSKGWVTPKDSKISKGDFEG